MIKSRKNKVLQKRKYHSTPFGSSENVYRHDHANTAQYLNKRESYIMCFRKIDSRVVHFFALTKE